MGVDKKAPWALKLVGGLKILKAIALFGLSLGVFDLIHKDLTEIARHFVQIARISPENHYVGVMLEKLGLVKPEQLRRIGELSALYATILMTEGLGLWFGTAWPSTSWSFPRASSCRRSCWPPSVISAGSSSLSWL